jgi:plastocyanin
MVGGGGSLSFSPANATVTQGATVHWVWSDTSIPHTVTSGSPGAPDGQFCSLDSGTAVNAQTCNSTSYAHTAPFSYDHVFDQPGNFPYYCTVHGAAMTGMVTVMPSTAGTTSTAGATGGTPAPSPAPTPAPTPTPSGGY